MKLLVLSDLHLEFAPYKPWRPSVDACDVVVLAGDIDIGSRGVVWARETFPHKPVVYVLGNHEFYDGHWDRTLDEIRQSGRERGIHVLENESVVINGVRFLGGTLWVDFNYFGPDARELAMSNYTHGLYDCHSIRASPPGSTSQEAQSIQRLTAQYVRERHLASIGWLKSELERYSDQQPCVVVTHHAPRGESVHERFLVDPLTPGFASKLDTSLIARASLWIHGHMHDSVDYVVDGTNTRVVCNPRGYMRRIGPENEGFTDDFIVDVET